MALQPNTDTVRPGARVLIGDDIPAVVTANTIRQDASGNLFVATLEVTWWDGRARHCVHVEPWEVTPVEDDTEPLGF